MPERKLVVIGASSGGLEAMIALLPLLAPHYGIPTVLVLHQRANRISGVPAMLAKHTHLRVIEPDDKQSIETGCLYVAPPNYHLLVEKEKLLSLSSEAPVNYCRPAIDITLETAASAYGCEVTACILSGSNRDGVEGARQVKQRGGRVYVQRFTEATVPVMPAAVAAVVSIDGELTLREIAGMLNALAEEERTR